MSRDIERIRNLFNRRLQEAGESSIYAKVVSVDEKARTCTLEINGIHHENVLLYSVEKPDLKGFCLIPKVGSIVIASYIGYKDRLYVALFSEVDKIVGSVSKDDTDFTITAGESVEIEVKRKAEEKPKGKNDEKPEEEKPEGPKISKISITPDLIQFNDGTNGGFIISTELKNQLTNLTNRVNSIIDAIKNGIPAENASDGGANLQTTIVGLLPKGTENYDDIINDKIKH